MLLRFLLFFTTLFINADAFGQQMTPGSIIFKDKRGLIIHVNPQMNSIGNFTGKLIQEQFDSKLFDIATDSTYSLTIDSVYKSNKFYMIIMTLYKFEYNPLVVSWFRTYHVTADWADPKRKTILKFYDYGYEL